MLFLPLFGIQKGIKKKAKQTKIKQNFRPALQIRQKKESNAKKNHMPYWLKWQNPRSVLTAQLYSMKFIGIATKAHDC